MSVDLTYTQDYEDVSEEFAAQLPKPAGYMMLLALPQLRKQTEGGIHIPESRLYDEQGATLVGKVIEQGPDCYSDPKRFPNDPWCKVGDWVVIKAYGGNRISVKGQEFRLISDDNIMGTVEDPTGIARI